MAEVKAKVINVSSGSVSFKDVNGRDHKFAKAGATRLIDKEVLIDTVSNEPGVYELFVQGFLAVEDLDLAIELNLPTDDVARLSLPQLLDILKNGDLVNLEYVLSHCAEGKRQTIAQLAIEYKITGLDVASIIKKYTNQDIVAMATIAAESEVVPNISGPAPVQTEGPTKKPELPPFTPPQYNIVDKK